MAGRGIQYSPNDHSLALIEYPYVSHSEVDAAIKTALDSKHAWQSLPFVDRAAVFLKAADLVAGKYRNEMLLATMIGQGKTIFQAEIDCAAELADFLRFNVKYAEEIYEKQPPLNAPGVWNRSEYRPLEGFVYAVSPFNFTAIAANLPCAPALMGNVVVWKPSPHAMLSNVLLYNILLEAGLPPGVIQFVPTDDPAGLSKQVMSHREFAALHFTGSTAVFREMYGTISKGIVDGTYRTFPRVIGETGGKNFHIVHRDADVENAAKHTVRAAFEYNGQKCSACSRAYVSSQVWPEFKEVLQREVAQIKQGSVLDLSNFTGPVIHKQSFEKCAGIIDDAAKDSSLNLVAGGKYDGSTGWFVQPTVYETRDFSHRLFETEIFGPILTVYVYDDPTTGDDLSSLVSICKRVDESSEYALTGSIFARSRTALRTAEEALRDTAGNFYLNCKCTGAVVGQQPFGGARASGTNDKAGSAAFLGRFVSPRSIKEEFEPMTGIGYPHMQ